MNHLSLFTGMLKHSKRIERKTSLKECFLRKLILSDVCNTKQFSLSHYTVNWSPRHSLAKKLEHKNWLPSFNDRKYLKASIRARIYVDYITVTFNRTVNLLHFSASLTWKKINVAIKNYQNNIYRNRLPNYFLIKHIKQRSSTRNKLVTME